MGWKFFPGTFFVLSFVGFIAYDAIVGFIAYDVTRSNGEEKERVPFFFSLMLMHPVLLMD